MQVSKVMKSDFSVYKIAYFMLKVWDKWSNLQIFNVFSSLLGHYYSIQKMLSSHKFVICSCVKQVLSPLNKTLCYNSVVPHTSNSF